MRAPLLIILIVFVSVSKAQVTALEDVMNNELKLNLLLLAQGTGEITYERLVDDRVGVGISTYAVLRTGGMQFFGDSYPWNFSMTPYARVYFGRKRGKGFFLEGNLMIGADSQSLPETGYNRDETTWGWGLGMAYGGKWIFGKNWIVEVYTGLGYTNLWDTPDESWLFEVWDWWFYPRMGVTLGKRF